MIMRGDMDCFSEKSWDSSFFGFPVYAIHIKDEKGIVTLQRAISSSRVRNGRLGICYVFVSSNVNDFKCDGVRYNGRVEYRKRIERREIYAVKGVGALCDFSDEVRRLSILSGVHSRFAQDPMLSSKYESMYEQWILNGFEKKKSGVGEVLGVWEEGRLAGLLSLGFSGEIATIELLSVDGKYHRRGIGRRLVEAAFSISINHGCSYINVATQTENEAARKLYEFCGFQCVNQEQVWHMQVGGHSTCS